MGENLMKEPKYQRKWIELHGVPSEIDVGSAICQE